MEHKETLERLDQHLEDSVKFSNIKMEIECYYNAYVALLPEWEKELKVFLKEEGSYDGMIQLKEKQIFRLKGKIDLLTGLKAKL